MQKTAASWPRCLLLAILLVPTPGLAQSDAVRLVIGGARTPRPDHLELLLELPPGTAALQPQDVQLLEDARATARARTVNPFRKAAGWNVATVVAVDTSRSMTKYLGPVRSALPDFVNRILQNDVIAIITFDDDVQERAPFAIPRDQLTSLVGDLRAAGRNTVLHKALDRSVTMLEQRSGDRTRRRAVVISDGADESTGDPTATDVIIQRALRSRVAIDTIWVGQPIAAKRNTLLRLAERTGGVHRDAIKTGSVDGDVKAALKDIAEVANNAVIASFDREVQTTANTKEIGVSVARPGVAAASIALQVPRSVVSLLQRPQTDEDRENARDRIIRWTIRLAPLLLAAYASYSVVYIIVKRRDPKRQLPRPLPDRWIGIIAVQKPDTPRPAPEPEKADKSRRHTMVAPEARKDPAIGHVHGLVLEAVDGPVRGQRIAVTGPRYQIGAGNGNDLSITTDKYLSNLHARIEQSQGHWMLFDQGSSNGTFVDGRRLSTDQGHALRSGESVRIGASEFRVLIAPAAAAGGVAAKPGGSASADERPV
jgi:Mg-chelatase subunit ChlD